MNEANNEPDRREQVRHLAEEYAERLRNGEQPVMDEYLDRVEPPIRDYLREELVGEKFAHRFGDATQDGALRYSPVEHLGKGAFAEVYRAHDECLDRDIAIKVLSCQDNDARDRFLSEARRQAELPKHDHLVAVHDSGMLPKGYPFVVMEFVPGGTLRQKLAQKLASRSLSEK